MEQARVAGRIEYERDDMIVLPARMLVEVKAEAYHLGELLPCVLLLLLLSPARHLGQAALEELAT